MPFTVLQCVNKDIIIIIICLKYKVILSYLILSYLILSYLNRSDKNKNKNMFISIMTMTIKNFYLT